MAFVPGASLPCSRTECRPAVCGLRMNVNEDVPKVSRRAALAAAVSAVAAGLVVPLAAQADIDYANVGYLGGGDQIDVNNANVRAYLKYPGFYPTLAGLIVSNGPYKSVDEISKLPGITSTMKDTLEKYKNNLVALEPAPEYEIDKLNNGLYK
jgi:photosystem II PsbU protein